MFFGTSVLDQLIAAVVGCLASCHWASVRSEACMSSLVVILVPTGGESLSADLALIWFLTGVLSHVDL